MATSVVSRPAGWFPDPYEKAKWRWWDGQAWTGWTEASTAGLRPSRIPPTPDAIPAPLPLPRSPADREELGHLAYVRRFLSEAYDRQIISATTLVALNDAAKARAAALERPAPAPAPVPSSAPPSPTLHEHTPAVPHTPTAGRPAPPQAVVAPAPARSYPLPAPQPQPVPRPAPVPRPKTWWDRTREAVAADLAVHGLAYLGVLLVFAGIFGTLAWGFRSFTPQQRALVELGVPLLLLGSGYALTHARAPYVGSALTLAGGLLLPLVLIASVLDTAPIPPDPETEAARYATLVVLPLLTGLAYGLIGLKRPSSPLRFLAAPSLWLAAAMAALPTAGPVLGGFEVATPHPTQIAVAMAAVPLTLLLVRLPRLATLRVPTELSAVVGAVVLLLLEVLASLAEDAVGWPLAATLALLAVTAELLAPRAADRLVNSVQLVAAAGAVLSLAPVLALGPWGLIGLVAGVALAEWIGYRRPDGRSPLVALGLGGLAALAAVVAIPDWYAIGGFAALTAWAVLRRQAPVEWLPAPVSGYVIGLAPLGALAGLAAETSLAVAAAAAGLGALALTLAVANRRSDSLWLQLAAGYAVAAAGAALASPPADGAWWRAGALAAGALALGLLRELPAAARAWPAVTGILMAAGLVIAEAQPLAVTAGCLAVAGAAVTVAAVALPQRPLGAHAGLAGAAVTLSALVLGSGRDALQSWTVIGLAALAAAALAVVVGHLVGRTGIPALATPWTAPLIVVAAVPSLAVLSARLVADSKTQLLEAELWPAVAGAAAAAAVAAAGGALARWVPGILDPQADAEAEAPSSPPSAQPIPLVLSHGGTLIAIVLAVPLALRSIELGQPEAGVAAVLAAIVATAAVGVLREEIETLAGVLLTLPLALTAAVWATDDPSIPAFVVLGWGALVLLATPVADARLSGPRPIGGFVRGWIPATLLAIGALAATGGWLATAASGRPTFAVTSGILAAVTAGVAVLLGWSALTLATWALLIVALDSALARPLHETPWSYAALTAALLAAAAGLALLRLDPTDTDRRAAWLRSLALPPYALAHVTALAALGLGLNRDAMPETWIPVGALAAAVGGFALSRLVPAEVEPVPARARTELGWAYVIIGAVVLLNGVAAIGGWWTVGALAAGAVLATAGAFLLRWPADLAASGIGAAHGLAASVAAAAIVEPSAAESAAIAALACGALVVAAAAAQWLLPRDRLAITGPWAALGLIGVLITAVWVGSGPSYDVADSAAFATAGGLALAADGLAVAAARLPGLGLWHAAAVLLAAAIPYGWLGADATAAVAAGTTLAAAAAAGLAVAFGWARRPAAQWVGPVLTLAAGLWCVGALLSEGDPDLWALALAIAAVLVAVGGLVGRAPLVVGAAAAPAYAAWVLIVSTHLTDAEAPWYSIPAGLSLLGAVGAIRWHLRAQGSDGRGGEVVLLELVGMLVLVSAPVVNAAEDPASAGLALALGVGLAAWGMVTKVRRRLAFGALTVLVTLVVIIAAPLVGLLRTWTGPLLWALVALAGLAALLVAAFLERGRGAIRSLFDRASNTFADWE